MLKKNGWNATNITQTAFVEKVDCKVHVLKSRKLISKIEIIRKHIEQLLQSTKEDYFELFKKIY